MELINDIIEFYGLVGGCNAEAVRGFPAEEIMGDEYKEVMNGLLKKYKVKVKLENIDDYLNAENELSDVFIELMKKG